MVTQQSCAQIFCFESSTFFVVARYVPGQALALPKEQEGPMREFQLLGIGLVFAFLGAIVVGIF